MNDIRYKIDIAMAVLQHPEHMRFEICISNISGIGTSITAKCLECDKIIDMTDYGSW